MKKRICLIATGGTIASRKTEHGLMPALTGQDLIRSVPELQGFCNMDFVQLMQLDSSNLVPEHWQRIAKEVAERYDQYDGFVITHGTDTMAYTSSALHYMLQNMHKPVVITGSQLPMGVENSDAPENLLLAVKGAISGKAGVYLAFAGKLIHGNKARKVYAKDFVGFESINAQYTAYFDKKIGDLQWQDGTTSIKENNSTSIKVQGKLNSSVVVIKLVPGTAPELIRLLADNGYKGIILEAFGAGGIPTDESPLSMLPAIDYAVSKGVLVVCTTQCVYDGVYMNTYEVGVRALEHGVLSGGDATTEALTVRLMLALGQGKSYQEAREIFSVQE